METNVRGKPVFDQHATELLQRLKQAGFVLYWEKVWRDYEIIEREIATCDALLAIVDSTWQSSTWMASEVTWANGQAGATKTTNRRMLPIPIFLYPLLEKERWGWLKDYAGPILLEREIDKAFAQISRIFGEDGPSR